MKLFIIAVCAVAAVAADVSHLATGHDGYHYNKPSTVFDLPQHAPVVQQQLSAPVSDYFPLQPQHTGPPASALPPDSSTFNYQEPTQSVQGHSNEYLPPQQQYPIPAGGPVQHQEISQPEYNSPSLGPVYQQEGSPVAHNSANEYLPPHVPQYIGSGHHLEIPQTLPVVQPQYTGSFAKPLQHQEISQGPIHHEHQQHQEVSAPANDYLPPQTQIAGPIQQTAPVSDYLPPQQHTPSAFPIEHHEEYSPVGHQHQEQIFQPIPTPGNEYLPPQSQLPAPLQQTVIDHEELSQPITAPVSDYLPPLQQQQHQYPAPDRAPIQHQHPAPAPIENQYFPPAISTHTSEYLPPGEQHQHYYHQQQQQQHLPQNEQHQQEHHIESQGQVQADGYHYDVPAKRFRF